MTKVLKFGGTSVGSAENMQMVSRIIVEEQSQVTVLSAMSGTTDKLVSIAKGIKNGDKQGVRKQIKELEERYFSTVENLFCYENILKNTTLEFGNSQDNLILCVNNVKKYISENILEIELSIDNYCGDCTCRYILSKGELMTSYMFSQYLKILGVKVQFISALDFMSKDKDGMVNKNKVKEFFKNKSLSLDTYYITQGFICVDSDGLVDNLGRGGSDYSAAIIGEAIGASEVQIWTDIDGIHNNDPRYVDGTYPIRNMSFDEAAELAYFGAKILHPATIQPCKEAGIAVRLKNTMSPSDFGTLISDNNDDLEPFRAVAAKDGITVIRITSTRMLMAYGFLSAVFDVFSRHKTSIDMITTSEVSVALTIDDTTHLDNIISELSLLGDVEIDDNCTIVSVVGHIGYEISGLVSRVLNSLTEVAIKMISYGANHRSISILVASENKIHTLRHINNNLFCKKEKNYLFSK